MPASGGSTRVGAEPENALVPGGARIGCGSANANANANANAWMITDDFANQPFACLGCQRPLQLAHDAGGRNHDEPVIHDFGNSHMTDALGLIEINTRPFSLAHVAGA